MPKTRSSWGGRSPIRLPLPPANGYRRKRSRKISVSGQQDCLEDIETNIELASMMPTPTPSGAAGINHLEAQDAQTKADVMPGTHPLLEQPCVENTEHFGMPPEVAATPPPPPQPPVGASEEVPLEIPSSPEETKPAIDPMERLKPPPQPRDPNGLPPVVLQRCSMAVPGVMSILISYLTASNILDMDAMIDLANHTFKTLDWLHADYDSFYRNVRAFLHYQCKILGAERQRNVIMARNAELMVQSNNAAKALSNAEAALSGSMQRLVSLRASIVETRELLSKMEEELAQGEAERARCAEAFNASQAEVRGIARQVSKANTMLKEIDEGTNTALAGIEEMKNKLSYTI